MKRTLVIVAGASMALLGCGDDGGGDDGDAAAAQSELADLLVAEADGVELDEQCVRDRTAELSDDDAQFLIDNIDATDTDGFSSELQEWVNGLIECLDDPGVLDTSGAQWEDEEVGAADSTPLTETISETDVEEEEAETEEPLASIGTSGFSTWTSNGETWASAAAFVTNDGDEDLFGTEVTFNFVGADGTPVATESTYAQVIPAGDSFPVQVQTYTDLTAAMPVTVEITAFADPDASFARDWVEMELGPTTITSDEYSSMASGTVTNPADEPLEYYEVTCVIVAADGSVVGGLLSLSDRVAPGQTIAWEWPVVDGPIQAGGVDAECRSITFLS